MALSMITVEIPEDQIVRMVDKLSAAAKQAILKRLILDYDRWENLTTYGESRMRAICVERGIDWDHLTEQERIELVDTLLHEA